MESGSALSCLNMDSEVRFVYTFWKGTSQNLLLKQAKKSTISTGENPWSILFKGPTMVKNSNCQHVYHFQTVIQPISVNKLDHVFVYSTLFKRELIFAIITYTWKQFYSCLISYSCFKNIPYSSFTEAIIVLVQNLNEEKLLKQIWFLSIANDVRITCVQYQIHPGLSVHVQHWHALCLPKNSSMCQVGLCSCSWVTYNPLFLIYSTLSQSEHISSIWKIKVLLSPSTTLQTVPFKCCSSHCPDCIIPMQTKLNWWLLKVPMTKESKVCTQEFKRVRTCCQSWWQTYIVFSCF